MKNYSNIRDLLKSFDLILYNKAPDGKYLSCGVILLSQDLPIDSQFVLDGLRPPVLMLEAISNHFYCTPIIANAFSGIRIMDLDDVMSHSECTDYFLWVPLSLDISNDYVYPLSCDRIVDQLLYKLQMLYVIIDNLSCFDRALMRLFSRHLDHSDFLREVYRNLGIPATMWGVSPMGLETEQSYQPASATDARLIVADTKINIPFIFSAVVAFVK
jgi:hypothetical protein